MKKEMKKLMVVILGLNTVGKTIDLFSFNLIILKPADYMPAA